MLEETNPENSGREGRRPLLPVRNSVSDLCNEIKALEDRFLENTLEIEQYFRHTEGEGLRSPHPSLNLPMTFLPSKLKLIRLNYRAA